MRKKQAQRGFTLIEMVVSVALFSIVMTVCVASLLALVYANRKAQGLQNVMNNLNVALDDMSRNIRMGSNYHCGTTGGVDVVQDCTTDGTNTQLSFEPYGGSPSTPADQWVYWYDANSHQIWKSITGSTASGFPITSPEVVIDTFKFYVVGAVTHSDTVQPRVVIIVKGHTAGNNIKTRSDFHIQVTAVQRLIDL